MRKGFTLAELMVVVAIIAIITAIAAPRLGNSVTKSREAALRTNLQVVRSAIDTFRNDTGAYPAQLTDVAVTTAPASGLSRSGTSQAITSSDWRGPYIQAVPLDPISNKDFVYTASGSSTGTVTSSADGQDSSGTNYGSY